MSSTNQETEDEVLKRMLRTPHKDHKPTTPLGIRRRRDREKVDK